MLNTVTRKASMATTARSKRAAQPTLVKQGAKFGLVGISNTVIDYTLFLVISRALNVPVNSVYLVKYFSGSVALINSFYWNRHWVFPSKVGLGRAGIRFLTATLVSVYLIQPQVVRLFSATTSGRNFDLIWYHLAGSLHLVSLVPHILTENFVIKTVAFAMGVACSAIWNFTLYKLWAFKE